MAVQRMDHVGVVVEDLEEAVAFFLELGLELDGEAIVSGEWVDRVVGLTGTRSQIAMLRNPGGGALELTEFLSPPAVPSGKRHPANAVGLRHLTFAVDDLDAVLARLQARGGELVGEIARYGDSYRLCYLRGPEGIIIEMAESVG